MPTFTFTTWSEQKAYILVSILRNAGEHVREASIPRYVNDGRTPHKSRVVATLPRDRWDAATDEMYARWNRIPVDRRR